MRRAAGFLAGFLLALTALLGAVSVTATRTALFERAVNATVTVDCDLAAFARETMAYLRGETDVWAPALPFAVAPAFSAHMAEVRGWVARAPWALGAGLLLSLCLLRSQRGRRMPLCGLLSALALLAALLLWAAADFDSLWMLLHRVFIPGGIFPAGEPIMRMFPLALFFQYIGPVCLAAAGFLAAACGLIFAFTKGRDE